jgi:hypothetical protein
MANEFQQDFTTNLLIPASGRTQTVTVQLPSASGYEVDMNQFIIDDTPFSPQAVTVDATSVPAGDTVLFELSRLGWRRIVQGGRVETFTVPAITNWKASVTPSDGISPVRLYLYNYPAFPDVSGALNNSVTLNGPVSLASLALIAASVTNTAAPSTLTLVPASAGQSIELHMFTAFTANAATAAGENSLVASSAATKAQAYHVFRSGVAVLNMMAVLPFSQPIRLPVGDSLQVLQEATFVGTGAVWYTATYRYI